MMVLLFDGVCNLCNQSVNWIIKRDAKNKFQFASLQSNYGKNVIDKFGIKEDYMNTVILLENEYIYLRSEAALRIMKHLGGIYSPVYALILIPAFIRDAIYNFVARNRYRWFGKSETCRLPTPEEKAKFLE